MESAVLTTILLSSPGNMVSTTAPSFMLTD
jgi:hypothetical protein